MHFLWEIKPNAENGISIVHVWCLLIFPYSGPFERRTSTPVSNRILLVGDSAGYLDPLTGEGIRMGLDSAQAALTCILHDQPHRYHKEWKRVTRRYWWMTGGLLSLREIPILRKLMVPTLKRSPWLFGHIVSALAEA